MFCKVKLTTRNALLGLLLLLPWLASCGGGSGGPEERATSVLVDSPADAAERDGSITLREALLLVTGGLAPADLDAEETDNITGIPGAASADVILFDTSVFPQTEPATIVLTSGLPALVSGNDTVDGSQAGVIVDGGGGVQGLECLFLNSDGNVLRGLQIQNCHTGIVIESGAEGNTIGGTGPGERNVISANASVGIEIRGSGNLVIGNYIGTDVAGTRLAANGVEGVWIGPGAQNNVIGGDTPEERNVISGNALFNVSITGLGATGNVVKGNFIGVDASGRKPLESRFGVNIGRGAQDNVIGGSAPGEGNVISGNGNGVLIRHPGTTGNLVLGNRIGIGAAGLEPVPNSYGVWILDGAQNNSVGGAATGEGNLIAENNVGVAFEGATTTGNTVRGNSIRSNAGAGLLSLKDGNKGLEPPTLSSGSPLTGTACPNCTVDVYSDAEDEGAVYEGSTLADGEGRFTFEGNLAGPNVTATATDAEGNTSVFAEPVPGPAR